MVSHKSVDEVAKVIAAALLSASGGGSDPVPQKTVENEKKSEDGDAEAKGSGNSAVPPAAPEAPKDTPGADAAGGGPVEAASSKGDGLAAKEVASGNGADPGAEEKPEGALPMLSREDLKRMKEGVLTSSCFCGIPGLR